MNVYVSFRLVYSIEFKTMKQYSYNYRTFDDKINRVVWKSHNDDLTWDRVDKINSNRNYSSYPKRLHRIEPWEEAQNWTHL